MGRRSSKAGHGMPTPDVDTVGMTILPGHPLPAWADPEAADRDAAEASAPGTEAMSGQPAPSAMAELEALAEAAAQSYADAPDERVAAAPGATGALGAQVPEPALVGATGAMATGAMATGAMHSGAFPTGALAAPPPPGAGYPGAGYPGAGHPGAGFATAATGAPARPSSPPPASPYATLTQPPVPQSSVPQRAGWGEAAAAQQPGAVGQASGGTASTGRATATLDGPPGSTATTPSEGWTSPDRPELSPEHVALLTWWADMIAKGQFPPPPQPSPETSAPPPSQARRRRPSRRTRMVVLGVAGLLVGGAAVAIGTGLLGGAAAEPAPPAATELMMPAAVGDLVPLTAEGIGAQLVPLLGFGLRPAGVTVTNGYGTEAGGPLVLAAMATTVPEAGDPASRLTAWADLAGASVVEPVEGSGAAAGITCASARDHPAAPSGSVCVWTGTTMGGLTYVVGTTPETALQTTADLRAAMPPATATQSAGAAAS